MDRKWTLFTFSRGDFKTVERYLNKQAERGWELEKTGILARWKRTDRRDLTYCVDLAKPKQDREMRLEYADLCAEGGWELTTLTGGMYIFKSRPGADLIPIHTDPELERKQYDRYYIRNTILSVVLLLAYIAYWVFLILTINSASRFESFLGMRQYAGLSSWAIAGLPYCMPILGIWAAWKIVDFIRAAIKSRVGEIGRSPRWVMWINNILTFAAGAGLIVLLAGFTLDTLFGEDFEPTLFVLTLLWGGVLLYRALEVERELFSRERRRYIVGGVICLLCFALLIVGRVCLKAGNWSTSQFADWQEGMEAHEQTSDLPLVHGEDVGIPFLSEESVEIYHEKIPAGEKWELRYLYGVKKTSSGFLGAESTTYRCSTEKQAKALAAALADGYKLGRYTPWPQEGLTSTDIDWADEAWYGTVVPKDGAVITALVLRVGDQVTRLVFPADLLSEENLEIIRAELVE